MPFCWLSLTLINIKMTQHKSLNVKLSISQLNEFESAIINENEVVLRILLKVVFIKYDW